ncbi:MULTISPECIES: hypothetical protein [unclassified Streptomyces]|uniref:hypothetical protein n=1 Tax=unclassified Streptomyces TaxID=2593676 RepID=UPI00093FB513|nr:hypothetical protein [Streptomyces sp. TSRI0107]OKJ74603.1 hypothetical protein AMK31_30965 [Streptomyces sp. TSRI0107]
MNDVQEGLCFAGPAVVTVFVIGAGNEPLPPEAFRLAGLTPDEVRPFMLQDQPAEIASRGLMSYDLTFHDTSAALSAYTREVLRRLCADGRAVAWAAFEGSFHYDHLLTEDIAASVYGYCASGAEPVVAWDFTTLRSAAWRQRTAEARETLRELLR